MIRTLIVDDEKNNRTRLKRMLSEHFPNFNIVGEAESVKSSLRAIEEYKPELVLLDIKMADGTAFDLLNRLDTILFKIIFVTAYEEYAVRAFKFSALDYMLKPVSIDELGAALIKAEKQILSELELQLNSLKQNLRSLRPKTLALRTSEKIYLLEVNDIIRCEADANYTYFIIRDQKKIIISHPLKEYEEMLAEHGFIRIHKSHLVNIAYIESFDKTEGGTLILKDQTQLPVSRRKRPELLEILSAG